MKSKLEQAIGHLGAALVQASPRDDEIIIAHIRDAHAVLRSLTAALAVQPDQGQVEGWKLVPVEPTWKMMIAGRNAATDDHSADAEITDLSTDDALAAYLAMLAAAPSPPPSPAGAAAVPASVGTKTIERARRAIDALRKPDASLARVPNAVRQSIAEVIESLMVVGFYDFREPEESAAPAPPASPDVRGVLAKVERALSLDGRVYGGSELHDIIRAALSTHPAPDASTTPPEDAMRDIRQFSDAELQAELYHRAQAFLGDPRKCVSLPAPPTMKEGGK